MSSSRLHRLAGRGDPFELLAALESGADPNEVSEGRGRTPLMEAAKHDNLVAARLLIRRGAKLDVVDGRGATALSGSTTLSMRRLLLDAGADPDLYRWHGATEMAFFAEFRLRDMVELFRAYGADTAVRMRTGPTVQEALDDPTYRWGPFDTPKTPERRQRDAEGILKLRDGLKISPERFVSEHRNLLIWSYGSDEYDDPRLKSWAERVLQLLRSPEELEAAYRQHLRGEELADALRSNDRSKRRVERDRLRKERDERFAALHLDGYLPLGET